MAFHPEVILTLSELHNQERVREAVQDRLAARAEAGTCARPHRWGAARRATVSWPIGWLRHVRGAKRVHGTAPQSEERRTIGALRSTCCIACRKNQGFRDAGSRRRLLPLRRQDRYADAPE